MPPRKTLAGTGRLSEDARTNRVLNLISRERVVTRGQIRGANGTGDLVALFIERGWLEPTPTGALAATPALDAAKAERLAAGNYATC
jgi:hypothetical protein